MLLQITLTHVKLLYNRSRVQSENKFYLLFRDISFYYLCCLDFGCLFCVCQLQLDNQKSNDNICLSLFFMTDTGSCSRAPLFCYAFCF